MTTLSKAISQESADLIIDWAKIDTKLEGMAAKAKLARDKMLDDLVANGVKADMLKGAGKGKENSPLYKSVYAALVLTQPVARQQALSGNVETMTKAQKAFRRESMQRVGSKLSKIQKSLAERLAPKTKKPRSPNGAVSQTNKGNAPSTNSNLTSETPLKKFIEALSTGHSIINRIPGKQLPPGKATEVKKLLGDLIEKLNAVKGK